MKTIKYLEELDKKLEDRKYIRTHVGEYVAVKNYKESIRMGSEEFQVSDPPYNEEDVGAFLSTLEASGIHRFCYTSKNTLTIDFLHACDIHGWSNIHIGLLHRSNDIFGEEDIKGIWVEDHTNN